MMMSKQGFVYYPDAGTTLCGACIDKRYPGEDVHDCGGHMANGGDVGWRYYPEEDTPMYCDDCGAPLPVSLPEPQVDDIIVMADDAMPPVPITLVGGNGRPGIWEVYDSGGRLWIVERAAWEDSGAQRAWREYVE